MYIKTLTLSNCVLRRWNNWELSLLMIFWWMRILKMPHFFTIAFIKYNANEIIFFFDSIVNSDSYLLDWSILATFFTRTRLIFFFRWVIVRHGLNLGRVKKSKGETFFTIILPGVRRVLLRRFIGIPILNRKCNLRDFLFLSSAAATYGKAARQCGSYPV